MSPTYWTATQIKAAVRQHGWELIKVRPDDRTWGARKGSYQVILKEDRRGGLVWVRFHYPTVLGPTGTYHLGPTARNKLAEVLDFLARVPTNGEKT